MCVRGNERTEHSVFSREIAKLIASGIKWPRVRERLLNVKYLAVKKPNYISGFFLKVYLWDDISNISEAQSGGCNEVKCPLRVPLKNHGIDESQTGGEGHDSQERMDRVAEAATSLIAHVLLLLCLQGTKLKNNINKRVLGHKRERNSSKSHKGSTNCLLLWQNNLTGMQDFTETLVLTNCNETQYF